MNRVRNVVLVALLCLSATVTWAQEWRGPASIAVEVKGKPQGNVEGALVIVRYQQMEPPAGPRPVLTDAAGQAVLVDLAPGVWEIEISHDDFLSFVALVMLDGGRKPQVQASFLQASGSSLTPIRVKFSDARGRAPSASVPLPPEAAARLSQRRAAAPTRQPATPPPTPSSPRARSSRVPDVVMPEPELRPLPEASAPQSTPNAPAAPPQAVPQAPPGETPVEPDPTPPQPAEPEAQVTATEPVLTDPAPAPASEPTPTAPAKPAKPVAEPLPAPAPSRTPPAAAAEPEIAATASSPAEPTTAPVLEVQPSLPKPPSSSSPPATEARPPLSPSSAAAPVEPDKPEPVPTLPSPTPTPTPTPTPAPPEAASEPAAEAAVPATAPAAPEPAPSTALLEPRPEALEEDNAPPPLPAPTTVLPAPGPLGPTLRAYRDRTCVECRPGEFAISVETVIGPADGRCNEATLEAEGREIAQLLGASITLELKEVAATAIDAVALMSSSEPAAATAELLGDDSQGCRIVAAVIPKAGRFRGVRMEAADATGVGDCQADRPCPVGRGRWVGQPRVAREPSSNVIWGLFVNEAPDRARRARLTVYFAAPHRSWDPPR